MEFACVYMTESERDSRDTENRIRKPLRIKLKCGLVCELTLRVNRHSNGQESPLSHHYVFSHLLWVIESYSITHNL